MDFKMPLGATIHLLGLIWISVEPRYEGVFIWMLPFFLLNIVGMALILLGKIKPGAILFIIGCIPFAPVGLIGALGAKKMLLELKAARVADA